MIMIKNWLPLKSKGKISLPSINGLFSFSDTELSTGSQKDTILDTESHPFSTLRSLIFMIHELLKSSWSQEKTSGKGLIGIKDPKVVSILSSGNREVCHRGELSLLNGIL